MHAYMHVCMDACMHKCMYACMHVCDCAPLHRCTIVCVHVRACSLVCVCLGQTYQLLPGSSLVALLAEQPFPGHRLLQLHAQSGLLPVPLPLQPAVDELLRTRRVSKGHRRDTDEHEHTHTHSNRQLILNTEYLVQQRPHELIVNLEYHRLSALIYESRGVSRH